MAKKANVIAMPETPQPPVARALPIARRGLHSDGDVIDLCEALIIDTLEQTITTSQAAAVNTSVHRVLKTIELRYKHGKPRPGALQDRELTLKPPSSAKRLSDDGR